MNSTNRWLYTNERTILSTKFFERLIMQDVFNVFNVKHNIHILLFVMIFKYNLFNKMKFKHKLFWFEKKIIFF